MPRPGATSNAFLLFTDIVGSVELQKRLGTVAYAALLSRHDALFKAAFAGSEGRILQGTGDGFLAGFPVASQAVAAALRFQLLLGLEPWEGERPHVRAGIHSGELTEIDDPETEVGRTKPVGMAVNMAARVMDLAVAGQVLMTRAVFDDARQFVRDYPEVERQGEVDGDAAALPELQWRAHGRYLFKGHDEPLEVFEVGAEAIAPLAAPGDTEKAKRSVSAEEEETLGWRPGAGLDIPGREGWEIVEKIGEGGFGEVWLAAHTKTKERRVFKFCFDADRLRSFKRELTFFRLLRDALGKRDDIAQLHEVQVDKPPFYLEGEYCPEGNLADWAERQGGIGEVPLETRLDLFARTARAVAAAHSVGVIHKDIKPSNIFIVEDEAGRPRPRLADFGIGVLSDAGALQRHDITRAGFTETVALQNESSRTGTRLYAAPEYLVGQPASVQGDIYALGVLLYQMAAGDLARPIGSGWERDIADPLAREDIAACIDADPTRRLDDAAVLAGLIQSRDKRRRERRGRNAAKLAVALAGVAAIVLGVGFYHQHSLLDQSKESYQELQAEQRRTAAAAAEARRNLGQSRFIRANDLLARGEDAEAIALLTHTLREDPGNRSARRLLGMAMAWHPIVPEISVVARLPVVFDRGRAQPVAFTPDGKTVVFAGGTHPDTHYSVPAGIWDVGTDWVTARPIDALGVTHVAVSPDGRKFATGSRDGGVRLWNLRTGEGLGASLPVDGPVELIQFRPDGTLLVAGGNTVHQVDPGDPPSPGLSLLTVPSWRRATMGASSSSMCAPVWLWFGTPSPGPDWRRGHSTCPGYTRQSSRRGERSWSHSPPTGRPPGGSGRRIRFPVSSTRFRKLPATTETELSSSPMAVRGCSPRTVSSSTTGSLKQGRPSRIP